MRRAHAAPSQPLHFIGWQYNPQIVADNVKSFEQLYNESVDDPSRFPANIMPWLNSRPRRRPAYDTHAQYSEEDHLFRWWTAKWVRDVEDQPNVAQIKAGMFPSAVCDLSLPNGKLGGLPYYAGFNSFVYNAKHLNQGKIYVRPGRPYSTVAAS